MRMTIEARVCTFAKPRGSAGSIRYFRDPVTVEVQEVSAMDAPVAMRWTSTKHGPLETRWFDGSHWFAFDRHLEGRHQERFTAADVARLAASPQDRSMNYLFSGYFNKGDEYAPYIDRGKFVEFGDADRERIHEKVRGWAADVIVVDGTLHIRCPEPKYHASLNGPEVEVNRPVPGWENRPLNYRPRSFEATAVYRADRYEDALAAMNTGLGDGGERIDVLVGESVRFADDREALVNTCLDTLNALGTQPITELPPSVIGSLAPLSACFWEKDWAEIDEDDAYDALVGFAQAVASSGYKLNRLDAAAERSIQSALDRWDDRPIALSVASEQKGPRP